MSELLTYDTIIERFNEEVRISHPEFSRMKEKLSLHIQVFSAVNKDTKDQESSSNASFDASNITSMLDLQKESNRAVDNVKLDLVKHFYRLTDQDLKSIDFVTIEDCFAHLQEQNPRILGFLRLTKTDLQKQESSQTQQLSTVTN